MAMLKAAEASSLDCFDLKRRRRKKKKKGGGERRVTLRVAWRDIEKEKEFLFCG